MIGAMEHRGPDDSGAFTDEQASLGATRLAILDLSAAGHQPMHNQGRTIWIVYNGEIYNYAEERATLERKGHRFVSKTDTEVVLRLYEEYGDDLVSRLRGMFAFAIYDKRRGRGSERLLLARDHFGIKPLVYSTAGGGIVFASEIKSMLASGLVSDEVEPSALRSLLTLGSIYQPDSILKDAKVLPPAHRLVAEHGRIRIERFWSLDPQRRADVAGRPYEELVELVGEAVAESVRLQLVSDVPLGAFLSGGTDSSLIVALMAQTSGSEVKTFSVGFEAEGSAIDESEDAARTASLLGTDHTRVLVDGGEVRNRISHIARSLDQPSVDGVNSYFVSLAARQGVTVSLSGTGGDELFAGYPWFLTMIREERERTRLVRLGRAALAMLARQRAFDPLINGALGARIERARAAGGFLARYARTYFIFLPTTASQLVAAPLRSHSQAGRAMSYSLSPTDELSRSSTIARVSALCLRGYTGNQLLRDIDAVSMAHSLEVRVPFLDPVLTDLALALPDETKVGAWAADSDFGTYRETGAKRILIDAARRVLPTELELQKKRGFGMPFESWLDGPLRDVLDDALSDRSVRARGLLDPAAVAAVRDGFGAGTWSWAHVWVLLMLELWCREVLDRPGADRSIAPEHVRLIRGSS